MTLIIFIHQIYWKNIIKRASATLYICHNQFVDHDRPNKRGPD